MIYDLRYRNKETCSSSKSRRCSQTKDSCVIQYYATYQTTPACCAALSSRACVQRKWRVTGSGGSSCVGTYDIEFNLQLCCSRMLNIRAGTAFYAVLRSSTCGFPHKEDSKFVHLHLKNRQNNQISAFATCMFLGAPNAYRRDAHGASMGRQPHISVHIPNVLWCFNAWKECGTHVRHSNSAST